jgi:predicted RNA-binding protein with PUA-like domain
VNIDHFDLEAGQPRRAGLDSAAPHPAKLRGSAPVTAAPSLWLIKSEPEKYAYSDLVRDGRTVWDGVRNNQAALYLKAMRVGDKALYYHSRTELAVVGVATVAREAFIDPSDPAGRFVAVEVAPLKAFARPVTLAEMKANPALAGMAMFRQFRLSVTPITAEEWSAILAMAGETET